MNIAYIINTDNMFPRQVKEAKIVDGALVMEDLVVESQE